MCQLTFALQQDRMGWEIVLREKKEEQDKSLGFTTQNKPEILGFTAYMCLNHHKAYGNNFNLKILIQCVWEVTKIMNYFTTQFILTTVYGSHCTF